MSRSQTIGVVVAPESRPKRHTPPSATPRQALREPTCPTALGTCNDFIAAGACWAIGQRDKMPTTAGLLRWLSTIPPKASPPRTK